MQSEHYRISVLFQCLEPGPCLSISFFAIVSETIHIHRGWGPDRVRNHTHFQRPFNFIGILSISVQKWFYSTRFEARTNESNMPTLRWCSDDLSGYFSWRSYLSGHFLTDERDIEKQSHTLWEEHITRGTFMNSYVFEWSKCLARLREMLCKRIFVSVRVGWCRVLNSC